jgi:hypothetical protein
MHNSAGPIVLPKVEGGAAAAQDVPLSEEYSNTAAASSPARFSPALSLNLLLVYVCMLNLYLQAHSIVRLSHSGISRPFVYLTPASTASINNAVWILSLCIATCLDYLLHSPDQKSAIVPFDYAVFI